MTNIITSISLNLNHLKITSPISALEHAHFGAIDKITVNYVGKKVTFSTPSSVAPHCSLQCGINSAAAVGSRPTAPPYTDIPRLPHYWKARQADSQTVRGRDMRTDRQTEGGACVGMAVASRGDFSSLCNPIPFQCED